LSDLREKYVELMHAEMDGEATDKELATLREYLARDPEAQRVHAELAKLTSILNQVEAVETPRNLHASIMAALPQQRRFGPESVVRNGSPWRLRIPLIRYAYALAGGLFLGAVLTGVAFRNLSLQEKSDVYGTLAVPENPHHYVAVEQMKLNSPGLAGSVELSRFGSNSMIVLDLHGQQAVEVEVGFDSRQGGLTSFSQQPDSIHSFEVKGGSISFQSNGRQRSTVILTSEKNAQLILDLKFYVAGKLVHQGTLGGPAPGGSLQ
jgi:hypothetical protein